MKPYVFDATPLIYLSKVGLLEKIAYLNRKSFIPSSVFEEVVVQGIQEGKKDALVVGKLVKQKAFRVIAVKNKKRLTYFSKDPALHKADAETLVLAEEHNGIALMDEFHARTVAQFENIPVRGTIFLLFKLLHSNKLTKKQLRQKLDETISTGWHCSTELYAEILSNLDNY